MPGHQFDSWESYLYPARVGTGLRTLRNKFDIRDPMALRAAEYSRTTRRARQIRSGEVMIPRTYDAQHLRAIHWYVFQDVYEWAGQYRTVDMSKGSTDFADIRGGQIDRYLGDAERLIKGTQWDALDRDKFAERAASVFAYVNQAHPFREGNGRASKVFMDHVAEQSRFALDYSRVGQQEWNSAAQRSGPDRGAYAPVPDPLVPVFRAIAEPRDHVANTVQEE